MEWASEFFDFYNLPTLTPEEVTQGMGKGYTQADLPRDISERFAYMTALITADEKQVEACRDFGIVDQNEIVKKLLETFKFLTEAQARKYVS